MQRKWCIEVREHKGNHGGRSKKNKKIQMNGLELVNGRESKPSETKKVIEKEQKTQFRTSTREERMNVKQLDKSR